MSVCPSVSVASRCSVGTGGRIDLVLAWMLLSVSPTPCFEEVQVSVKIRVFPDSLEHFPKLRTFRKFHHGISIVEACCQKGGCSQRDKLSRRRQWTVPPSCVSGPLVYHSDRQTLSTARFRRAGP